MKTFLKNIVKLKKISTIKDFRFGTFPSISGSGSGSGYTFYRPPLRSALAIRCLRIHGFVFCKYTISLPCFFKRWETMIFPQRLMQEWQETGCNILFMTRHTLSVPHREKWRFLISGYPAYFVSYRSPCSREVWP